MYKLLVTTWITRSTNCDNGVSDATALSVQVIEFSDRGTANFAYKTLNENITFLNTRVIEKLYV